MTPSSFSQPTRTSRREDNTRELLGLIADDARSQLRRRLALSAFLRCPFVLTPNSRKETAALVSDAISILRASLGCAKGAIRAFRKHRYERCMNELDRIDRLRKVLENIDRLIACALLSSLTEGRRHGRRD